MTDSFDALEGLESIILQLNEQLEGKAIKPLDNARSKVLQDMLGHTAIAQQLSRIAASLESIDGHLTDLLTEYRDRDWKGIKPQWSGS